MHHTTFRYALALGLLALAYTAFGQQTPRLSQFTAMPDAINPGAFGSRNYLDFKVLHRAQWSGIEGAPQTTWVTFGAQLPIPELEHKHGVGGMIVNDQAGDLSRTGLYGAYAFHLKLTERIKLSFGTTAGLLTYRLDNSNVRLTDPDDPAAYSAPSGSAIDANFGLWAYDGQFFAGLSANHLLPSEVPFYNDNALEPTYFAMGGLRKYASAKVAITTAALIRASERELTVFGNISANYANRLKMSLGYGTNGEVTFMPGLYVSRALFLQYAYETPVAGEASGLGLQTHSLSLSFRLPTGNTGDAYGNKGDWFKVAPANRNGIYMSPYE